VRFFYKIYTNPYAVDKPATQLVTDELAKNLTEIMIFPIFAGRPPFHYRPGRALCKRFMAACVNIRRAYIFLSLQVLYLNCTHPTTYRFIAANGRFFGSSKFFLNAIQAAAAV
jgi:hypothetical protein